METTRKQFELFKSECRRWMYIFQINDYDIYFQWKDLGENDAVSHIQGDCGNITFTLGKEVESVDKSLNEYIKELAKHETIHCLLGRFSDLATKRYISFEEMSNEEEHLVRKLCNIII